MEIDVREVSKGATEIRDAFDHVAAALSGAEWDDSVRDSYDQFYYDCMNAVEQIEGLAEQLINIQNSFSNIDVDGAIESANDACEKANNCY